MTTFDFDQRQFFRHEWAVAPSINIQYQSTGVGSLPFLDKIQLEQSIQGLFLSTSGTFQWMFSNIIFYWKFQSKL